jgi:hypothetical protein
MEKPIRVSSKLKYQTIQNIKEILSRNPKIKWEDVKVVGLVESGKFQYNVPSDISNLKVLTLLAYLKWYFKIGDKLE